MPTQIEAIKFGLQKTIYKKSFYDFVVDACKILEPSTNWDFNWHIKYLCDLLQKEAERINQRLPRNNDYIINVPFRSSKSLIFSVLFPAWVWTWFPECKIMTISYAESLAVKQSYLSKILINSEWYKKWFSEVQLMRDDNQKGAYTNTTGGKRESFGMNGAITGSGADIIIVDDPNKVNESRKQLENANTTFDEMIFNRLNDPDTGVRFVVQQRTKQNDVSGHLQRKDDSEWETICIPAELGTNLNPPDLVVNYKENLFWIKRFSKRILKQYKTSLGSRGYNSQLNQRTSSDGGNILKETWFKRLDYDDKTMKGLSWDAFVDSAYTDKTSNDPSAVLIAAKFRNGILIKKVWVGHLEFPELIKKLNELGKIHNVKRIFVEPKASGKSVVQQLRKETKHNVIELKPPKDDKETRVNGISPIVEAERVYLLDGSWNESFIDEVTNFPNAVHDDQTDTLFYAVDKLISRKGFNYKM